MGPLPSHGAGPRVTGTGKRRGWGAHGRGVPGEERGPRTLAPGGRGHGHAERPRTRPDPPPRLAHLARHRRW